MPFTLARLRLGRSPTRTEGQRKDTVDLKNDVSINSRCQASTRVSHSRFSFSWFKKRTRSESYDTPPPRPPTPTPFLISRVAASAVAKEIKSVKKSQNVRPGSMYSLVPASISKPETNESDTMTTEMEGAVHEDEDDGDDDDDEMTDAERTHLNSFAHGLRGLIAELQRADEEARVLPPTKNADGIPLSPIIEAEELDFELGQDPSFDSGLDEGALEEGLRTPCPTASYSLPTRSQFVQEGLSGMRSKVMAPLIVEDCLLGGPEHGDDDVEVRDSIAVVERTRVDEIASLASQGECPGETEDDQEYFSADPGPTPPASSSEDEDDDNDNDQVSESGFALRLLGLDLARPSTPFGFAGSSGVLNGNYENAEDGYDEDEETDHETSPTTPRVQHHLQLRPRAVTLASAIEQLPSASRAPPHLISPMPQPHVKIHEEGTNEAHSVEELMRTVTRLQGEKARLERALAGAERRIGEQSIELVSLTNQIITLRAAVRRLADIDVDWVSFASDNGGETACGIQYMDGEGQVPAAAELGSVQGPLSTPPATPDRQTASVLVEAAPDDPRLPVLVATTGRKRGLVRRKSASASSSLHFGDAGPDVRELGIGRAQIKRRVGSADLKSANTAWS